MDLKAFTKLREETTQCFGGIASAGMKSVQLVADTAASIGAGYTRKAYGADDVFRIFL